jgi:hypothetical protein
MVPADPQHHTSHGHVHHQAHPHAHGPAAPHPAQVATWSLLRMPATARLGAAVIACAALWAVVLIAMR